MQYEYTTESFGNSIPTFECFVETLNSEQARKKMAAFTSDSQARGTLIVVEETPTTSLTYYFQVDVLDVTVLLGQCLTDYLKIHPEAATVVFDAVGTCLNIFCKNFGRRIRRSGTYLPRQAKVVYSDEKEVVL